MRKIYQCHDSEEMTPSCDIESQWLINRYCHQQMYSTTNVFADTYM